MSRLEAVVFDFDGLILDTETSAYESARDVFDAHGVELDRSWWTSIIGVADHKHWTELLQELVGAPIDHEAVRAARNVVHHAMIEATDLQAGVVELLAEAAAAQVPVAVASSSPLDWVGGHLERRGLRDHFLHLATRDTVSRGKPWPDLYEAAVRALGADPSRSVALEDAPTGVRAAKAAGLKVVGVPAGMTVELDFSEADRVVGSLADLTLADLTALVA